MWLNDTKGLCINSSPCRRAQGPTYLAQEKLHKQVLLFIKTATYQSLGFPGGAVVKNLPANAGEERESRLDPWLGRSPRGGNGNPFQYSCLGNPMDKEAWWATQSMGSQKSWTQVSTHAHSNLQCLHLSILPFLPSLFALWVLTIMHAQLKGWWSYSANQLSAN